MLLCTPAHAVTFALAVTLAVGASAPAVAEPGTVGAVGTVAVADLSSSPQPAMAEALRKGPGIKGRAQPAAQTAAVVDDAKGLGLACKISEDACLEKLLVLLRTDELVAFSLDRGSVRVVRVVVGKPIAKAKVAFAAPATTARAALLALDTPAGDGPAPLVDNPVEKQPDELAKVDAEPKATVTPDAPVVDEGFSPMLIVGVVGGVVTAGCAAGALGTSASLAARETSGESLVGSDFLAVEGMFTALLICSAAGVVATGVGFGLYALEAPDDAAPVVTSEAAPVSGR